MTTFTEMHLIKGIKIMNDEINIDSRGYFSKIFSKDSSDETVLNSLAIANNLLAGTIRGLHFQTGSNAEEKIIKCIRGIIFDVVVDLRLHSRTFGQWSSIILNADSDVTLHLPIGIAHGYQSLEDNSQVLYGLTGKHDSKNAHVIKYDDNRLNINWPMDLVNISSRDMSGLTFEKAIERIK
jgi:dTDP-4-dehydrorhamnose 3,5-epimerase